MGKINFESITNGIVDAGKIAIIAVASAGVFEATSSGVVGAEKDCKKIAQAARFNLDKNSYTYKVKKGFWKKPELVRINPLTGKVSAATPGAKPINTKAVKFYK